MQLSINGVKLDSTGTALQTVQPIFIPGSTTTTLNLIIKGQNGLAINLAGATIVLSIRNTVQANGSLLVSRSGTVDDIVNGLAHVIIANTDTAILRGAFVYDITLIASNGNTDQIVPVSPLYVIDSLYAPSQPVTVLPAQLPLGAGPQGIQGIQGLQGPAGPTPIQNSVGSTLPVEPSLRFNATMTVADSPGTLSTNVDVNQANPFAWTTQHSWSSIATPAAPAVGLVQLFAQTNNGHTDFYFQDNDTNVYGLGRDVILRIRNQTGVTINKGQVVYINGSNGNVPTVALAQADSTMARLPAYGVATASIANNAFGHIMTRGSLIGVDTSAFTAGDTLYVSAATPGLLTNVAPSHPNVEQAIGIVAVVGVGNGTIALTTVPINLHRIDGTNQTSFSIGDGTGTTKNLNVKNASGVSSLSWNPTAARTVNIPDASGTLSLTAYSATTPTDWATSPPTTIASALDRIAAALNALGHKA